MAAACRHGRQRLLRRAFERVFAATNERVSALANAGPRRRSCRRRRIKAPRPEAYPLATSPAGSRPAPWRTARRSRQRRSGREEVRQGCAGTQIGKDRGATRAETSRVAGGGQQAARGGREGFGRSARAGRWPMSMPIDRRRPRRRRAWPTGPRPDATRAAAARRGHRAAARAATGATSFACAAFQPDLPGPARGGPSARPGC